jgi:hypothetical protein
MLEYSKKEENEMSKVYYKGRNFSVYLIEDELMQRARKFAKERHYSLSRLGKIAVTEKLGREEEKA